MPRVALVTCAELPELDTDDQLAVEPLRALGVDVETPVWDDPAVDWAGFDLVVLRNPWDYARRREQFLAWAHSVPRLLNPAKVVEWNTDKVYLRELAAAGLPVVPTTWLTPGDAAELPDAGEYVVKPSVSAGSADTGRYDLADAAQRALARAQVEKLLARGSTVMLQPYLTAVDTAGETAMLHLGGVFSHAIRKGALLDGPDLRDGKPLWSEQIEPREPTAAERDLARRTLDAIPGSDTLLYARVDTIPGPDGAPVILEVELTEPSLFLATSPGAPQRLARAITARL
ncbi:RimK family alpha-L-glutamate ligase [Jiangella sp. DSM 45060]|uniref:ATP-grasp domain-containing protein n=1 Tax=Jiangella sp. DSM 45060 TaxID=1798224 RepID=UPI00087CB939|nr:hypothetical protein [Jiangella sp. DSM 45060]SDT06168.1 hypothetical protein SAMN04515669_2668 [Jiangella sp. DSM 45060]